MAEAEQLVAPPIAADGAVLVSPAEAEALAVLDAKLAQSKITREEHAALARQLRTAAMAQLELVTAWADKPPEELAEHVLRTEFGRMMLAVHSHKTIKPEARTRGGKGDTDAPAPYTAYFIGIEIGASATGGERHWTLKRRYSDFHALWKATRRDPKLATLPFPDKKGSSIEHNSYNAIPSRQADICTKQFEIQIYRFESLFVVCGCGVC